MTDERVEIDVSGDSLIADARAQAGLDDFGGDAFRTGLRVLLETYAAADLKPSGWSRTRARLVQLLVNRLRLQQAFAAHPEVRERPIARPVYLAGLPRTGTSALFNLLGMDPAHRPLLLWEGMHPDPVPVPEDGVDPRLAALRKIFDRDRERNPEFDKIHYVNVEGPEECVLLLAHTFCDVQLGIEPLLEPYGAWFQAQDLRAPYAYYADLLRLLDWQRPGERWLLKSPAHLWALDVLVEMFPDVCIVQTHRDPLEVLPSYCSMMAALMSIRREVDKEALGPVVLEYLARSLERGMAARDASDGKRFADVAYTEFVADPVRAVEGVYAAFDLPLSQEGGARMRAHVAANPRNKHGAHRYSLEEYGLSAGQVCERLSAYLARFDVPSGDGSQSR